MNSQNAQKTAIELLQENVTARASTNHVVTYQLPVPLGDCSVHLQIFEHKVTSAFIMDGGKTAADVPAEYVIRESLELIRKLYFDNKPEGFLSAWVVTHWDEDHFQGVIKLIEDKTLVNKYFKPNKILYAGSDDFPLWKNVFDARTYLIERNFRFVTGRDVIGRNFFGPGDDLRKQGNFCCVGGDGYSYKGNKFVYPSKPTMALDSLERVQNTPTPNEKSLLSLVIWENGANVPNRFSYFTGGDGNPKLEFDKVVPNVLKNKKVTVVKLDHHGSAKEFDHGKVVEAMNPDRVIVTPGHQYGHPCWDVIHQLHQHFTVRDGRQMFTTRLPYWADEAKEGVWQQVDVNVSTTDGSRIASSLKKKVYLEGEDFLDSQVTDAGSFHASLWGQGPKDKSQFMKSKPPPPQSQKTRTRTTSPIKPDHPLFDVPLLKDDKNDKAYTSRVALEAHLAHLKRDNAKEPLNVLGYLEAKEKAEKLGHDVLDLDDVASFPTMKKIKSDTYEKKASQDDRAGVVFLAMDLWNDICAQELSAEIEVPRYYLLQMFSSNDNKDGEMWYYPFGGITM